MILFYIIAMAVYGFARATQQAPLFLFKNGDKPPSWDDESKEIHFYGWFEPLSIVVASSVIVNKLEGHHLYEYILFFVISYFLYLLPYALTYNMLRDRDWFVNRKYQILGLSFTLLTKTNTVIGYFLSLFATIYWDIFLW